MPRSQPAVSIGLPVYNGASGIREALESLLAQDFSDFELIVSDNASTDATESICHDFAARDPRVCYVRHAENHGSVWNFEFVARQARAEFFMWAAHDDSWHPSYIRRCLDELRAHPTAILCCSEINFIDSAGKPLPAWHGYRNISTIGLPPARRLHEIFSRMGWFAWYGLMRREVTLKISLGLSVIGFDVLLLAELLLLGDFVCVEDRLFTFRIAERSTGDYAQIMRLVSAPTSTPYSDLAASIIATVYSSPLSPFTPREKAEILADALITLARWNQPWRAAITAELIAPGATLTDAQFASLLLHVLSRAVPLAAVRENPLVEFLQRAAITADFAATHQILALAENLPASLPALPSVPRFTNEKSSRDAALARGARFFELGRFPDALREFDAALRDPSPADPSELSDAWCDWATIQLASSNAGEAERGFRHALWLDSNNGQAGTKLGLLLAGVGRTGEAIPILELALTLTGGAEGTAVSQALAACRDPATRPPIAASAPPTVKPIPTK